MMLFFPGFVFVYIGCGGWDGVWGEGMGLGRQAGRHDRICIYSHWEYIS